MLQLLFLLTIFSCHYVSGQFGPFAQDFDYVTVREGAHMFYWMFYTTAPVEHYTERPLVVWLQGGPGGSSTGIGNFQIMGPMDLSLQNRNYTWVKNFNVMYLDNPVGTGFSYVDNPSFLTTTNDEIAVDFVNLMRGFYAKHPEFEGVPLYIYGQSYGGKMVVDMALRMREGWFLPYSPRLADGLVKELYLSTNTVISHLGTMMNMAEEAGTIGSNLRGIAMGNAWIAPVDLTLTWGPLLLAAGLVEEAGYLSIQQAAAEAEALFNQGQYFESTAAWSRTQGAVFNAAINVDFYDITTKMPVNFPDTVTMSDYERARELMINDGMTRQQQLNLNQIMNVLVKPALGIPDHVQWSSSSNAVFDTLRTDFMKPVTDGIERLLNETDIILTKYNGNLDLICSTPGQMLWVDKLKWSGAEGYKNAPRLPIWEDGRLEGYYKSYENFRFFWINVAGHSVPADNPAGSNAFLRDMTSFPLL